MEKIVFVILHYLSIDETCQCVRSILDNIIYKNKEIVIVDNGSNIKDDVKRLKLLKESSENVHLILSDDNLGYARGNNLGIAYSKDTLKADFIVVLNNDTLIKQDDFCQIIIEKYHKYNFAVLGPKVILRDGSRGPNPLKPIRYSEKKLFRYRMVLHVKYALSFLGLDMFVDAAIHTIKGNHTQFTIDKEMYPTDVIGAKLHGCCIIFSPMYFKYYMGFNSDTFLYMEEDILFERIHKRHLVSLFSQDLEVIHLEDAATNMLHMSSVQKRRFIYANHITSINAFIKELRGN